MRMTRRTRIHYPGAIYHVMARGVDGRTVFIDEQDFKLFLSILFRLSQETGFSLKAYCLMGNHFHLAIKVSSVPLSRIMQRLLTQFVLTFNSKYGRTGHLFQARYKAYLCINDRYLLNLIRYIHLNPVRAKLVENPIQWPWSSHRNYVDVHERTDQNEARDFDPWPNEEDQNSPMLRDESHALPSLDEIAADIASETSISISNLKRNGRFKNVANARKRLLQSALNQGHPISSVAQWLGCTPGTAHTLLYGRADQKNQKPDPKNRGSDGIDRLFS